MVSYHFVLFLKNVNLKFSRVLQFFSLLKNIKCMVRNPNQNIYSFVSIVIWRTLEKIHNALENLQS